MNYPQWQRSHIDFYLPKIKKYNDTLLKYPHAHLLNHALLLCVHSEVDNKQATDYTQGYEHVSLVNNPLGAHILGKTPYMLLHVITLISNGTYHQVISKIKHSHDVKLLFSSSSNDADDRISVHAKARL